MENINPVLVFQAFDEQKLFYNQFNIVRFKEINNTVWIKNK